MRIVVNDIAASGGGGGLTLLESFHRYVRDFDDDNEWVFLLGSDLLDEAAHIRTIVLSAVKNNWLKRLAFDLVSGRRLIRSLKPDVVFSMQNTYTYGLRCPQVVYVHQALPFQKSKVNFSLWRRDERLLAIYQHVIGAIIKQSIRRADHVIVQTQWMRAAILEEAGIANDRVVMVRPDLDDLSAYKFQGTLDPGAFFCATSSYSYKNNDCIYAACRLLREQGVGNFHVTMTIEATSADPNVIPIGRVPREQVLDMLSRTTLIFPSLIETYGLPLAEARALDALVLAADLPYAREVLDGYPNAYYFDPSLPNQLASLMRKVITGNIARSPVPRDGEVTGRTAGTAAWATVVEVVEGCARRRTWMNRTRVDQQHPAGQRTTTEQGSALSPARAAPLAPGGREARSSDVKRLCLVVPEFRPDGQCSGGLDAVAQFVLDAFTPQHGWTVQVASPRMWHRAGESGRLLDPRSWMAPRERDVVLDGVPIRYFGANLAELELARYQPRAAMTRFLDEFDAVLVVGGSPAIVNVTAKTRRPVVAQIATFIKEERRSVIDNARGSRRARIAAMTRLVARLDESALRIPRVTLVENQHMLHECRARGVNVQLIAPGVDCDTYHPGTDANRSRFILGVGRWADPRKDLPTLLRAFARSRQHDGIEQRLVLAGLQGPSAEDRELMRSLGVEDVVEVRENVPIDQLALLYRSADLFALTSTEEGLGLVFLEAMASGTPIVATSTEGAQHALGESGAGELVTFGPDLVDRFSLALSGWCQDAERRKHASLAARRNVEERFNAKDAGARFRRVVEDSLL